MARQDFLAAPRVSRNELRQHIDTQTRIVLAEQDLDQNEREHVQIMQEWRGEMRQIKRLLVSIAALFVTTLIGVAVDILRGAIG